MMVSFFFQAEDGIRDGHVTGVQTCALPIYADLKFPAITDENGNEVVVTHGRYNGFLESKDRRVRHDAFKAMYETYGQFRSEERRVGKECRSWGWGRGVEERVGGE